MLQATVFSSPAGNVKLLDNPDDDGEISRLKRMQDNHRLRLPPKSHPTFPVSIGYTDFRSQSVEPSITLTCRGSGGGLSSGRVVGLDDAVLSERCGTSSLGVDVLFAWTINSNLDSDLTTVNFLAVHLAHSLLLQFLRSKRNKTKATTFTRLTTSLELLDHVAGDRSKSDLGGSRAVGREELLELHAYVSKATQ